MYLSRPKQSSIEACENTAFEMLWKGDMCVGDTRKCVPPESLEIGNHLSTYLAPRVID